MTKRNKKSRTKGKFEDPIILAVKQGNLEIVQNRINRVGLNFSQAWLGGYVLLCTAITYHRNQIASWLISKNCPVNRVLENDLSDTPLHLAIHKNDDTLVSILLENGASPSAKNTKGETPLHISCYKNNVTVSKLLLEKDNIGDIPDDNFTKPLHIAVINEFEPIIRLLLDRKVNLDSYTIINKFRGFSSLHIAVIKRNEEIARLLLDHGADINAPIGISHIDDLPNEMSMDLLDYQDYTPFHLAIALKYNELIDLFLGYNANVNCVLKDTGETPLHIAIQNKDEKSVLLLSECNADFKAKTKDGKNVLHLSIENNWPKLIRALLLNGADINDVTDKGETPLFISVEMGDEDIVELLLDNNADVNIKNLENQTPLHVAAEFSTEIVTLLLETGASVDEIDKEGETPLSIAIKHGDYEIIEQLLKYKPNIDNPSNKAALVFAIRNYKSFDMNILNLLLEYGFKFMAHDAEGTDILYNAVSQGYIGILKHLLINGTRLDSNENDSLIHKAVLCQNISMIELLIQYGCNLNAIDNDGQTAVGYAIEQNNLEILDMLLTSGAQIRNVAYPLLMSAKDENILLVEKLLKYGADVNVRDEFGTTALHFATWNKHHRFIQFLLDKNARINTTQNNTDESNDKIDSYTREFRKQIFTSPLHIAVSNKSREICLTLLEHHAEVNSKDGYGRTALHIASAIKSAEQKTLIKSLISYGADINIFDNFNKLPMYYVFNPTCVCSIAFQNQYEIYRECECHLYEDDDINDIVCVYVKHIVFLSSMAKNIDKENLNILLKNEFAEKLQYSCSLEMTKMKAEKICDNVTFYDILVRKSNALAAYARNENIINAFESMNYEQKFPIYCDMLKDQFEKARTRDHLLESSVLSFSSLVNVRLPQTVLDYIFDFLHLNDLKNISKASENCYPKKICHTNSVKKLKVY